MSSTPTRPSSSALPLNTRRYASRPGHVESYFLRANDPRRPRALWLKATILAPLQGPPIAETWFIWFDGEKNRTFAHKDTWPWRQATFASEADGATSIRMGGWNLDLRERGAVSGRVAAAAGEATFDLAWTRMACSVAEPLSLYPWHLLIEGPFPRSKLLTPYPWLRFSGQIEVLGETVRLDGWDGMQGHNWGREHAFEYAWGQCLFSAHRGEPDAMVEGFTGRVRLAGRTSPRMSALVVRRGERTYRFDRIFDYWRQEAHMDRTCWTVRLASREGEVRLRMDATGRQMACLGYQNPDGQLSYCFNSKLAEVLLEVRPRGEPPFTCRSEHGGALEFLRREAEPHLPVV